VRDPAGLAEEPIFPLTAKYYRANYSVEGLEAKTGDSDAVTLENFWDMRPPYEASMDSGSAVPHVMELPSYKYSIDGKKLNTNEEGTWKRRSKDWRPVGIPDEYWVGQSKELKQLWRDTFPDPSRQPLSVEVPKTVKVKEKSTAEAESTEPEAADDTGLAEADFIVGLDDEPVADSKAKKNY